MLLKIVAVLAAAATAAGAPPKPGNPAPESTVSPVVVTPSADRTPSSARIDVAGDDDGGHRVVAFWPATAYRAGVDGQVTLSCLIDIHGLAEHCDVAAESPKNLGFGRAALALRPTFKLTPAKGPDGAPIDTTMSVSVSFKAPDLQFDIQEFEVKAKLASGGLGERSTIDLPHTGNPLPMREVTMMADPVWAQAAGFDDLAAAYPATGAGAEGYADARCGVERSGPQAGALTYCRIIKEAPEGRGFGKAALTLTGKFRVAADVLAAAPAARQLRVDLPIRLAPPEDLKARAIRAPVWLRVVDAAALQRAFPREATDIGLHSGLGVAHCVVGDDGAMASCVPEAGQPNGYGFSEAAARLATTMKVNLWSADGAPVKGGVVQVPLRLDAKGAN